MTKKKSKKKKKPKFVNEYDDAYQMEKRAEEAATRKHPPKEPKGGSK